MLCLPPSVVHGGVLQPHGLGGGPATIVLPQSFGARGRDSPHQLDHLAPLRRCILYCRNGEPVGALPPTSTPGLAAAHKPTIIPVASTTPLSLPPIPLPLPRPLPAPLLSPLSPRPSVLNRSLTFWRFPLLLLNRCPALRCAGAPRWRAAPAPSRKAAPPCSRCPAVPSVGTAGPSAVRLRSWRRPPGSSCAGGSTRGRTTAFQRHVVSGVVTRGDAGTCRNGSWHVSTVEGRLLLEDVRCGVVRCAACG